ncbi:exopolygalacturonate lyase, partial [Pasteurellaceae bacterium UScroc12]
KNAKVRFIGEVLHQASFWHVENIEVAGASLIVQGSYNEFRNITTHSAPDTGFQITSPEGVGRALWASHNIVKDSISFNNMDKSQINADGFAAKMRVGDGNTFIRCISHHNIDDGWDLFNKVEDGPNGVVTILDSIAFMNGQTLQVQSKSASIGNGFKLGGEGIPVAHIVKNSLAFHNNMDGFTDNFNPGALLLENNLAIDNRRFNYLFRKSPYEKASLQGTFINNQSFRFYQPSPYPDVVNGNQMINNDFLLSTTAKNAKVR